MVTYIITVILAMNLTNLKKKVIKMVSITGHCIQYTANYNKLKCLKEILNEDKLQQRASNFSMQRNHAQGLLNTDCRVLLPRIF